jgi:hypothetical protein
VVGSPLDEPGQSGPVPTLGARDPSCPGGQDRPSSRHLAEPAQRNVRDQEKIKKRMEVNLQCCGSGINIADPESEFSPSRIRTRIKEFKYFIPKKCFLSLRKYDSGVHPGSGSSFFLPIPDPGVKKAPDPGSATM